MRRFLQFTVILTAMRSHSVRAADGLLSNLSPLPSILYP